MNVPGTRRALLVLLASSSALGGCYDSQWGATKRAQTHNAAYSMPATLTAADGPDHAPAPKAYRVHAFATAGYASENLDHGHEIRALVDAANVVVGPAIGVRLEIDRIDPWNPGSETDLEALLGSLRAQGEDADWLVGFVGATPIATDSFHDVGRADNPGRHMVLRAASRLSDHVAADHAFDELPPEERTRVVRARKEHRALAVFLHELGHTLGAVHETDATSVMRPTYDKDMTGFTAEGLSLVRLTLAHRADPATPEAAAAFAQRFASLLDGASKGAWVEADRQEMLERMRTLEAPKATTTAPIADASPPLVFDVPELGPTDLAVFARAKELAQADDVDQAWTVATPLFRLYPAVYPVQDLRCQLATKRLGWPAAEPECAPLMKLTRGPTPPPKKR